MNDHTSKEWLHQKYVVEGLGCPEIGQLVGRDAKTIFYWLRKFDIQTRPRGHDERQHFKKGVALRKGTKLTEEAKGKIGEASRRRGAVPYMRNGKHWLKTVPSEANPSWKGGITPERQAFYATEEWKEAEKAVWLRDSSTCQRCGSVHQGGSRRKFHVHHVVRFEVKEWRATLSNLVLLCSPCHRFVHSKQNVDREFLPITTEDRIDGCQSTNHSRCYGDLWQCEQCRKTVCCNEGTTDQPELCDDCWCEAQRNEEQTL